MLKNPPVCIVGLGYVGLPLAYAFAKKGFTTLGFDINPKRIAMLKEGKDWTNELSEKELKSVSIEFSNDPAIMERARVIILAIPTPVDEKNLPDLSLVESATRTVGKHLKKGAIVVYESTVYPGVTEELCGPILERESGLKCGTDFKLGYSPERINPGDKKHTIDKIVKVVAGQDEETLETLAELYGSITEAGVHRASSLKVAEMAKAIENAQRDLNIAFMNEIAILCNRLGMRTQDVLRAAATKWNFLAFSPGLVGGHCIGVDPYYLVEKARQLGMTTHVITAGRAVNDGMSAYVAVQVKNALSVAPEHARVLVLGLTFKENVPDTRNSKALEVVTELMKIGCAVEVHDPFVSPEDLKRMTFTAGSLEKGPYDAICLLVRHTEYELPVGTFLTALKEGGVLYDLKSVLDERAIVQSGRKYLAL